MTGHRASLAGGLYEGCKKESDKITFHFQSRLVSVQSFGPRPKLTIEPRDGKEYEVECDILLACDGIKSVTREAMLKDLDIKASVVDTKQAAYRIMLDRKDMEHDPELLELININGNVRWIGEKKHIIAYPVSSHTVYNLSTCQPDTHFASATNETYTTKGSKPEMLKTFEDFAPIVQKMLNMVPDGEVCAHQLSFKCLPPLSIFHIIKGNHTKNAHDANTSPNRSANGNSASTPPSQPGSTNPSL